MADNPLSEVHDWWNNTSGPSVLSDMLYMNSMSDYDWGYAEPKWRGQSLPGFPAAPIPPLPGPPAAGGPPVKAVQPVPRGTSPVDWVNRAVAEYLRESARASQPSPSSQSSPVQAPLVSSALQTALSNVADRSGTKLSIKNKQ